VPLQCHKQCCWCARRLHQGQRLKTYYCHPLFNPAKHSCLSALQSKWQPFNPEVSSHRCNGAPSGSGGCGAQLYTLEQQVAHKAALLSAHFLRPGRPPLLILAHSIGAASAAAPVVQQSSLQTVAVAACSFVYLQHCVPLRWRWSPPQAVAALCSLSDLA